MYKLQFLCCKFSNLNRQYRQNRLTTNYFILTQQFSFIITHFCYITCFFCWWWGQTVIYNQLLSLQMLPGKLSSFLALNFSISWMIPPHFKWEYHFIRGVVCRNGLLLLQDGTYYVILLSTFWLSIRKRFSEFLVFLITQMVRKYAKI